MQINYKNSFFTLFFLSFIFSTAIPTHSLAAGPAAVNLGTANNFVILSKTGISTTGSTSIVGDLGLSPAAASYITGFALILPSASAFSTSALVTGKIYASDYTYPTPSNLTTAVLDMQTAYTDAMGRAPTVTELSAGSIGGLTFVPGVYKWGTGVTIPTNITLSGSANDVWIFQIAQNLNVSGGVQIVLSGGAQASNIFWVVAGQTTIGTTAVFNGNILDQTAIVLNTGAVLNGRALAQTAVTLDANAVTTVSSSSGTTSAGTQTQSNTSPIGQGGLTNTYQPLEQTTTPPPSLPIIILGCNGNTGFSTSTGESCLRNTTSAALIISYNFGAPTLRFGSQGAAVMDLQKFLNVSINAGLVVDGKLGPITMAAIKIWQTNYDLVSDGIVGMQTKLKMYAVIAQ